jgi:uridine kinase
MRVIGIAGPSCSGKTTIAQHLARVLNAQLINADLTYIRGSKRPLVKGENGVLYESFERAELYDHARIARALSELATNGTSTIRLLDWETKEHYEVELTADRPIIIEGFALYTHEALTGLIDEKYWIEVSVDESIRRRLGRGGRTSDEAYAQIARSERRWIEDQKHVPGVIVLDGTEPIEALCSRILD